MTDRARRKELTSQYRQKAPDAGVFLIRNTRNGKGLLGSTMSLASARNRLDFARATGSPGALDLRLRPEIAAFGLDAFELEVLEALDVTPEMTADDVASDLATLEGLWREKLAGSLY